MTTRETTPSGNGVPSLPRLLGNSDDRQACLDKIRAIYEHVVGVLEQDMQPGTLCCDAAEDAWQTLAYAHNIWVREIMTGCAECDFTLPLPLPVQQEIQDVGRCLKSSRAAEQLFNHCRAEERCHRSNKLGRVSRWHRMSTSPVMADLDRRPIHAGGADDRLQVDRGRVPIEMFKPDKETFSLGDDTTEKFLKPQTWPSPAPFTLSRIPQATLNILEVQGKVSHLGTTWLAKVVQAGTVVIVRRDGVANKWGYVLRATTHCLILLRLVARQLPCGDGRDIRRFFEFPTEGAKWEQIRITDINAVRVSEVELLPPSVVADWLRDLDNRPVSVLRPTAYHTALNFAAHRAFKGMTVADMKNLCDNQHLALPEPRPKLEREWAAFLIQHYLPSLSDEDIDKIIKEHRGQKKCTKDMFAGLINETNADCLEELLEPEEAKEIRDTVTEKHIQQRVDAAVHKRRKPRKLKMLNANDYNQEEARGFLPADIRGCSIYKDTEMCMRWKAVYPTDEPPYSCNRVWNASRTSKQALFECLRWVWGEHARMKPDAPPCPYDLSGE